MKPWKLLVASATIAVLSAAAWSGAHAQAPGPTSGEAITTGLLSPRGMKIGPDGMLYVAEAGEGGATTITVDGAEHHVGNSGRISKIDPDTGERTTVADGLHSDFSTATMDSVGPADVAFLGGNLYYVQTHGGEAYGAPDTPTGVYRVNDDGSTELVGDIGAFNIANPVADIQPGGGQEDIEPGGNPYAMTVRDGAFYVTDGNQNQLMKVDLDGTVSRVAEFSGHPVTTGIATQDTGPVYVANLGKFPFAPEDGTIYRVGFPSGTTTQIASGVSSMTDVEFGPGGQLYALNFADQDETFSSGGPFLPFSGKVMKVGADGSLTPVVGGLTFATAIVFNGDTAYVANNGLSIPGVFEGEIVKIENVSSLAPIAQPTPAPEPTTAPAPTGTPAGGTITPPNTGTGPAAASAPALWVIVAIGAAGLAVAGSGAAVAARRRP
jgi:hypothetical protein